jgi:membrane-associated protease RseP (regulator of RpoE activity)
MFNFRLFNVPIRVEWYFWLMAAVLVPTGTANVPALLIWVACVFVSIVVHELGHALAARRFGLSPFVILYGMGGLTYSPGAERIGRGRRIMLSLAGPAAGLALAGLVWLAWFAVIDASPLLLRWAMVFLLWINIKWTLLNLLPIPPLDGGQVLANALGPRRATITRIIGGSVAVGCCLYELLEQQLFLAFFFGLFAYQNLKPQGPSGGTLPVSEGDPAPRP